MSSNPFSKFLQRAVRKLNKTISSWFFLDQYVILTARDLSIDSLEWSAFKPLIPPPDRYWADPFVVERGNHYFVFVEEKIYEKGRGHITCLELGSDGELISSQIVLEHSYHLSYPFLLEHDGQLYMLPESAQNRTVELYRCVRFPDQWEFVQNLMQDVYAVDATLIEYESKWWLFANVKQGEKASSFDQLFVFYADSPFATDWKPHPQNPVVSDIRYARPAGKIFFQGNELIRPSQDSSARYGYALNFNRIAKLSESEYEESCEARLEPPKGKKILATHTFNKAGEMTVIDAVMRRRK